MPRLMIFCSELKSTEDINCSVELLKITTLSLCSTYRRILSYSDLFSLIYPSFGELRALWCSLS
jgi:hypothetical protein